MKIENEILERVKEKYQDEFDISLKESVKTNTVITGIMFSNKKDHTTFNVLKFPKDDIDKAMEAINEIVEENKKQQSKVNEIVEKIKDYNYVKEHLYLKLVNYEWNKDKLLQNCIYKKFLNLAIVPYIEHSDEQTYISNNITKEMLTTYGISEKELFETAMKNAERNRPTCYIDINNIILGPTNGKRKNENINDIDFRYMVSVTNKINRFGATCLLYPNMLKNISIKMNENFYIIPSSVHEIIVVPVSTIDKVLLANYIEEVNKTEVDISERLADIPYVYDISTNKILYYKNFKELMEEDYSIKEINNILKDFM